MNGEKLVRDKIPEIPPPDGKPQKFRKAEPGELGGLLLEKLNEEVAEVGRAIETQVKSGKPDLQPIIEELADVLEVIGGLATCLHIKASDVQAVQKAKREKKGGFFQGVVLVPIEPTKSPDPVDQGLGWGDP